MILDAEIKEDGTLIARVPEYLTGRKIQIVIRDNNKSLTSWNAIADILTEADRLNVPQRDLNQILDDLRTFRETK
ncbi:MAG: hypothetical protein ONB44_17145 [candidate division KSB1 bacterium]|nr:hypothetical protein [candidate division KSB1 bacterium]MDZ7303862.1 hypothetical protein [candidate division KSB1 bacterium]MDZ7313214.1 hypothetical protein [candidate division KSB1 bacterium]